MNDEFEPLTVGIRTNLAGFRKEIGEMRNALESPLVASADRGGRAIEAALLRAARSGKFGFEDLGKAALAILSQIAAAALHEGLGGMGSGGQSGGGLAGGLLQLGTTLLGNVLGLPGRATGGPVSPGRSYLVGERGPEVFLPTSSGQVMPSAGGQAGARDVRVSISVTANSGDAPRALARSARQVARAVRGALGE